MTGKLKGLLLSYRSNEVISKAFVKNTQTLKASCGAFYIRLSIYNLGHNILILFDVLPNFPFTTSKNNYDD